VDSSPEKAGASVSKWDPIFVVQAAAATRRIQIEQYPITEAGEGQGGYALVTLNPSGLKPVGWRRFGQAITLRSSGEGLGTGVVQHFR